MGTPTLEEVLNHPHMAVYLRSIPDADLRQEARIAIWKQMEKSVDYNKNYIGFLVRRAKWAVQQKIERGNWTGQERRAWGAAAGTEHPESDLQEWSWCWAYEDPALDYENHTELYGVIRKTLTDTEKVNVYRHFWVDEDRNLSSGWWSDPRYGVKAKLQRALGDLYAGSN